MLLNFVLPLPKLQLDLLGINLGLLVEKFPSFDAKLIVTRTWHSFILYNDLNMVLWDISSGVHLQVVAIFYALEGSDV